MLQICVLPCHIFTSNQQHDITFYLSHLDVSFVCVFIVIRELVYLVMTIWYIWLQPGDDTHYLYEIRIVIITLSLPSTMVNQVVL